MISIVIKLVLIAALVAADQGIKLWASSVLQPVTAMPVIPGIVELRFVLNDGMGTFKPGFALILPAVSLILYVMARKAILADEALVRAADRIR